jgi:hypothetical protein
MKRELISIIVIATCFVASNTSAHDKSLQPGHACRYYGKQGSDSFFTPSGTNANGLMNTSTTARVAVCAINKDPDFGTNLAMISFSNSTADCALYWRHRDGTSWGSWAPSEVIGNSPRTQAWGRPGGYDSIGKVLSIYCSVSAGVAINSFHHQ